MALVTREWVRDYINNQPREKVERMVGRALIALMRRQTEDEQASNITNHSNSRGFSAADARSGTITAKSYLKWGRLKDWQLERWTRVCKNGYPRLAKYARQLDCIAGERAA